MRKKLVLGVIALLAVGGVITGVFFYMRKNREVPEITYEQTEVTRNTIENTLSGTGTLEPVRSTAITAGVQGEIISADFEEGDEVKKGQVLYRISTENLDGAIEEAKETLEKAQKNYERAVENKSCLNVKSKLTGIVDSLEVGVGDSIRNGDVIAEIVSSEAVSLQVPFSSEEASTAWVGKKAEVLLTASQKKVTGEVTAVGSSTGTAGSAQMAQNNMNSTTMVTIRVPVGSSVKAGLTARATVSGKESTDSAKLSKISIGTISSTTEGTIAGLNIKEGGTIKKGNIVLSANSTSIMDAIEDATDSVEKAKEELEEIQECEGEYTIKAPYSGVIATKSYEKGDEIGSASAGTSGQNASEAVSQNQSGSTELALLYDLSTYTFSMSVDELDISSVEVGQSVTITADAFEGETYQGTVTKVSLVGTTSGGVTTYPVTVKLEEPKELLPGMNVSAQIVTESAENVLTVPVSAVVRGDMVYTDEEGSSTKNVETGITDGTNIEIKSGLSEGEMIYIPVQKKTTDSKTTDSNFDFNDRGNQKMGGQGMPGGNMPGDGMNNGGGAGPQGGFGGKQRGE